MEKWAIGNRPSFQRSVQKGTVTFSTDNGHRTVPVGRSKSHRNIGSDFLDACGLGLVLHPLSLDDSNYTDL